jgi:hypothetical protein
MVEALRVLLTALVGVSLCAIAAYVVGFIAVSVATVHRRSRPDPLLEDLDRALEEILGRSGKPEPAVQRSRGGRR